MSTDISEMYMAFIIRAIMMEAACTFETSVDIQLRTWQYLPEDSELVTMMFLHCHDKNQVHLL
jgi:hypothetical protein